MKGHFGFQTDGEMVFEAIASYWNAWKEKQLSLLSEGER